MHGLRCKYAQRRYEHITGWKPPLSDRPPPSDLERVDRQARTTVARELGHNRREVSQRYVGK